MLRVGYGISGTNILSIGRGVSVGGGGGWRGPYDAIPSIAALYAMRRALSDYTGPILRLRRDSDNTEQDIGYVANGDLDTAALASWLGEANGYITTWYDQSGNANHATQATAAAQPLFVASGHLVFDGSDDYLATDVTVNRNSSAIVRFSGATTIFRRPFGTFNFGSNGMWVDPVSIGSNTHAYFNEGSLHGLSGAVAAGVMGIAGGTGYLDGVSEGAIPDTGNASPYGLYIGARNFADDADSFFIGNIYEFVVSSATYDATTIAAITDIMEAA